MSRCLIRSCSRGLHMTEIRVLTPTGTLGYGFGQDAFQRAMSMNPDVIAVDAGSTDPGPYYLGSGKPLVSDDQIRRELKILFNAACANGIPLIVGSAGGSGAASHLERTADIVREIARSDGLSFKLAVIRADIEINRAKAGLEAGEIIDFEAGRMLTVEDLDATGA